MHPVVTDGEPVLEAVGLYKSYFMSGGMLKPKRELKALRGVDLKVMRGRSLALVGESGCGKSTLAMTLLGQVKPNQGEVRLGGSPIKSLPRRTIARKVQPILQDPYSSLNPRRNIGDIIELPLYIHGLGNASERRKACLEAMDMVGLARRYYDHYPNQLSGGQRQRVAIARALIMRPEIVVCDEPTSALDVSVQSQILNLLTDLQRELGLTYLLISHNLAVVQHMADSVAVMYCGRIVEEGPADAIFRGARHPYTQALIESVLTPEPGLGIPDTNLGAIFPDPSNLPPGCAFEPRCAKAIATCATTPPQKTALGSAVVECHLHQSQTERMPAAAAPAI